MFTLHAQLPALANGSKGVSSPSSFNNLRSKAPCKLQCFPVFSGGESRGRMRGIGGSRVFASVVETAVETGEKRESLTGVLSEEDGFPVGLHRDFMPKHVTFIMDGNGRWARERGLYFGIGYERGMAKLKEMVEHSYKWGIEAVSFYAFSTENWRRPTEESDFLMKLFEDSLRVDMDRMMRLGIRYCMVGDTSGIPESLQRLVKEAEEATKNNTRFKVITAINYSGQYEIAQACRRIADKVRGGELEPKDINEMLVEKQLETSWKIDAPLPDLMVRTSGELRVSNYLLWQLAYTEFFFLNSNWPDFGAGDYVEALRSFQNRKRRFGKRSE